MQNGTIRYSNVAATPTYNAGTGLTTITTHGGYLATVNDCNVLDTAAYPVTENRYSNVELPFGWKHLFHWVPTIVGFSANPTSGVYSFKILGDECEAYIRNPNSGTSNSATFTFSLPLTAIAAVGGLMEDYYSFWALITSNNVRAFGYAEIENNGNVLAMGATAAGAGGFATSGNKRCNRTAVRYRY